MVINKYIMVDKLLVLTLCLLSVAATNKTYTANIWIDGDSVITFTNCIKIQEDHEKKIPPCTLITHIVDGKTNEFHAFAVPVIVFTNK